VIEITDLALEYSFVTPYTSFVLVVKEPLPGNPRGVVPGIPGNNTFPSDIDDIQYDTDAGGNANGGSGSRYGIEPPEGDEGMASSALIIFMILLIVPLLLIPLIIFGIAKANRNVLDQQNRKRIYDHIINNPGDHFRSIQRAVDLEVGTLSHHINVLEKEQLIVSEQDGINRLFYPAGMRGNDEKVRLSRVQENILRSIRSTPGRTQSEIAKDLGVSRKVIYYHVQFLRDSGMVNEDQVGSHPRYYPN
jgi:predicted transcriptional regulator